MQDEIANARVNGAGQADAAGRARRRGASAGGARALAGRERWRLREAC